MPTIAVIGASPDRNKFGNKCVRAYLKAGYQVFPVHPTETEIEGLPVFDQFASIPVLHVDRVSVYLPPAVALKVIEKFDSARVGELWLNPGVDTAEVIALGNKLGLKVIPSCSIVAIGFSPAQFPG